MCTLVIFLSLDCGRWNELLLFLCSGRLQWDHVNLRVLDYELIEIPEIPLGWEEESKGID